MFLRTFYSLDIFQISSPIPNISKFRTQISWQKFKQVGIEKEIDAIQQKLKWKKEPEFPWSTKLVFIHTNAVAIFSS